MLKFLKQLETCMRGKLKKPCTSRWPHQDVGSTVMKVESSYHSGFRTVKKLKLKDSTVLVPRRQSSLGRVWSWRREGLVGPRNWYRGVLPWYAWLNPHLVSHATECCQHQRLVPEPPPPSANSTPCPKTTDTKLHAGTSLWCWQHRTVLCVFAFCCPDDDCSSRNYHSFYSLVGVPRTLS